LNGWWLYYFVKKNLDGECSSAVAASSLPPPSSLTAVRGRSWAKPGRLRRRRGGSPPRVGAPVWGGVVGLGCHIDGGCGGTETASCDGGAWGRLWHGGLHSGVGGSGGATLRLASSGGLCRVFGRLWWFGRVGDVVAVYTSPISFFVWKRRLKPSVSASINVYNYLY
jgi:hypothetical protein